MANFHPSRLAKPSGQEIAILRKALSAQGIAFPKKIDQIETGVFGICFISGDSVFKLFQSGNGSDYWRRHFNAAVLAYRHIDAVKDELAHRGVAIPVMQGHGWLNKPVQIGNITFHAWYVITRLDGAIVPTPELWWMHKDIMRGNAIWRILTATLAKYHVPVDAAGKTVATPFNTEWVDFRWLGKVPVDGKIRPMIGVLQADIRAWTASPSPVTVFLHGDPKPHNFLKTVAGVYQPIDWDQQKFGCPELEFWHEFALRPERIGDYCRLYNRCATQPISERRVTAYALAGSLGLYFTNLKDCPIRYSQLGRIRVLKARARRISLLADRLHRLTGKKAYAALAKYFTRTGCPIGKPRLPWF